MKKTLAIVLALVMVCSVLAMIPASAAETEVLGWKILNPGSTTLTKVNGTTVKVDGQGYYGNENKAAMIVSTKKVDISNGFSITLSGISGFNPAADSWLIVGFSAEARPDFTNSVMSGASVWVKETSGRVQPFTTYGYNSHDNKTYKLENWGPGVRTQFYMEDSTAILDSKATITISIAKSGAINQFYVGNGSKVTNVLEDNYNGSRIAGVDEAIASLGGECYVWVALSQRNSETQTDCAKTTVTVSALEPEQAPVTGDIFTIYAAVAAISVAVVATSVVVLRKKEEQF